MIDTQKYEYQLLHEARCPGKRIRKLGTVKPDTVECTPVVWQGRLLRSEWAERKCAQTSYTWFVDMETEETTSLFAHGVSFTSAYTENGEMFVFGSGTDLHSLEMFRSRDLSHWQSRRIFDAPDGWTLFNTSVCSSPQGYVMAVEINGPSDIVGVPFTVVYLRSSDLENWTLSDPRRFVYSKDRYTACPVLRWCDGFYYEICLEAMPLHHYVPYIVRTADLEHYELGIKNPVLFYDDDDKYVAHPERFTQAQLDYIAQTPDINASDVDLCEYGGKTVILYSWGIQLGKEFLARAEYDGGLPEFFRSFF